MKMLKVPKYFNRTRLFAAGSERILLKGKIMGKRKKKEIWELLAGSCVEVETMEIR